MLGQDRQRQLPRLVPLITPLKSVGGIAMKIKPWIERPAIDRWP